MPQYDPKRSRPRQTVSDEEPAPVDALLEPQPPKPEPPKPEPPQEPPSESPQESRRVTPMDTVGNADAGTRRMVLITTAVVTAVLVLVWLRRRSRR